ncbi:TetR/AcrR family transcriptional regulator [Nocardia nova]|uniref:TetR/AcrR family transcriptional regulator n=1 Tax=Nocardia nova TaxID=37330 RepID=UPI00046D9466|nr:TetR/AcrR family transcriptional regulator [Nocardia nova]
MATIVSKEQYFEAALSVLADGGFKSLNIGVMCRRLGVTSGSFYNYFGNWEGFVRALLEYWEGRQNEVLRGTEFGSGDAHADLEMLRDITAGLDHAAEAAIRAWSMNDELVRTMLTRVDENRYKTTRRTIQGIVDDESTATALADLGTAMLFGYQQMVSSGRKVDRTRMFDDFVRFVMMSSMFGRSS